MSQGPVGWLDEYFLKQAQDGSGNVLPARPLVQYTGTGVTVVDDPTNNRSIVTITGGGGPGQGSVTLANGLNSNIATGGQPTLRFTGPTANFSIGGLAQAGTPSAGQTLVVRNTTTHTMTVVHEDASSTAAYRIDTQSGLPVVIPPGVKSSAVFMYDGTSSRWMLQNIGIARPVVFHALDFATGNGSTDDSAAVVSAANLAAAAGAASSVVHFGTGTYRFASNTTLPTGVTYRFHGGAVLAPDSGMTVTIAGHVESVGDIACFGGNGTIAFSPGATPHVKPDWWGTAVGLSTCPIQSAVNAAHPVQIPVHLNPVTYPLCTGAVGLTITASQSSLVGPAVPSLGATANITTVTNTTPVVVNVATSLGLSVGQLVQCVGVSGVSAGLNGIPFVISALTSTSITLAGSTAVGAGTGGIVDPIGGAVLNYTGSGTAVSVGTNPGTGQIVLDGLHLENFRIQCVDGFAGTNTTKLGMVMYGCINALVRKVHLFGMSGSVVPNTSGYGFWILTCVDSRFEQCDIQGQGTQTAQANYLGIGVYVGNNFATTTTVFDQCYIHYCQMCTEVNTGSGYYRGCAFEASLRGFTLFDAYAVFDSCHWEDTGSDLAGYESMGYVDTLSFADIRSPNVVMYTGQSSLFEVNGAAPNVKIAMRGGRCTATVATPYIINHGFFGSPFITIQNTSFTTTGTWSVIESGADTAGGCQGNWKQVKFSDLPIEKYSFVKTSLAANLSTTTIATVAGNSGGAYTMPDNGYVVGMVASLSETVTNGSLTVEAVLNGSTIALEALNATSAPIYVDRSHLGQATSKGDKLTVTVSTGNTFAPAGAGQDLLVDVFVALGSPIL